MLKFAILLAVVAVCCVQADNKYLLYTKANSQEGVDMSPADDTLPPQFNIADNTIMLIHGHGGSMTHAMNVQIRNEILARQRSYNVIVVDWQRKASGSYSSARSHVESVAADLGTFFRWLSEQKPYSAENDNDDTITPRSSSDISSVNLKKVHLVGFGLGAHVAGIASRELLPTHPTVGRITGLDPSGSGWDSRSSRLRKGDAEYVEIIHTDDSGPLANGIGTALGDKDFYANGGSNQPGCFSHSCSHNRAYELFAASMRGHLRGNGCSSKTQMNLNLCRGSQVQMGGTDLFKDRSHQIYRINTGRIYPF